MTDYWQAVDRADLQSAVNAAVSFAPTMPVVLPEVCHAPQKTNNQECPSAHQLLTRPIWENFANPDLSVDMKMDPFLCHLIEGLRLAHPSEKTYRLIVSIMLLGMDSRQSIDAHGLLIDIKHKYKLKRPRLDKSLPRPVFYPRTPAELKRQLPDVYNVAFKEHNPEPCPFGENQVQEMTAMVPLRKTHACLRQGGQQGGLGNIGAPGMQGNAGFSMLQLLQLMQAMQQGIGTPANAPTLPGLQLFGDCGKKTYPPPIDDRRDSRTSVYGSIDCEC
jgi:hypothetical protein